MIEEAINAIAGMVPLQQPVTVEIAGRKRLFVEKIENGEQEWVELDVEQPDPKPPVLVIHTLTGLVDYVKRNLDVINLEKHALHVVNHQQVALVTALTEKWAERRMIVAAQFEPLLGGQPPQFKFGEYTQAEQFNVALQALFVATDARDELLRIIGSIRQEKVQAAADDGVSQQVIAKAGVVLEGLVKVPNPVTLAPFRTFREVEQPESKFVLRLQQGREGSLPLIALFEADGGAWKLEAIQRIRTYLELNAPGVSVFA